MMHPCLVRFSFLILALAPAAGNAQSSENQLGNAEKLFDGYRLAESHKAYRDIASNSGNDAATRVKAWQKLAEQDWKFYHHYAEAQSCLQSARRMKADAFGTALLAASINLESFQFKRAKLNAHESLNEAASDIQRTSAGIIFARVILDQNFQNRAHSAAVNRQELAKAAGLLSVILQKQPGNSDASELLIGTGLLLQDGDLIIRGWKSYYLVSNEQNINQAIKPGFELLAPVLRTWKGGPLSIGASKTLALGFAASKFFDYASFMAAEIKIKDGVGFGRSKALTDIDAYSGYINDVKKVNELIYPQVARGRKKYEDAYDSLMNNAALKAWKKLSFISKKQKFDPDTFYNVMNRKFGMAGYSGTTVNYYGMLMGHIIHKELKEINQYGYRTKFTYISVDRLISRDFTSWYGTTNVGGWGDSTTIIQVRKAYMTEPFQLLGWVTDSTEHRRMVNLIAKDKQQDLEICKKDPYAEPRFLALSIKFNEASKIYKHLTDSGLRNMDLSIAFIDEILKLTVASTVFAHEGRHAIDQLYFAKEFKAMSDDERELRAKFSEVVYSLNPKMAFTGSILGSALDESTNHGKANKRFRKIIADWMLTHESEIGGLDKDAPLLMQFELLTDKQLIAICRSTDELANMRAVDSHQDRN